VEKLDFVALPIAFESQSTVLEASILLSPCEKARHMSA
jgi:hypothetical protein